MGKTIEITPAEAAAARLLVKLAGKRGETIADATRAMAAAESAPQNVVETEPVTLAIGGTTRHRHPTKSI